MKNGGREPVSSGRMAFLKSQRIRAVWLACDGPGDVASLRSPLAFPRIHTWQLALLSRRWLRQHIYTDLLRARARFALIEIAGSQLQQISLEDTLAQQHRENNALKTRTQCRLGVLLRPSPAFVCKMNQYQNVRIRSAEGEESRCTVSARKPI
jgi:hypothetical protein